MKQLKNMQIIGIDNGYGNLKTASGIFPASVLTFDHEPIHAQDLLVYDGKYHVIGSGHREFTPDKVSNPDHYVLTLAGIGQELWKNRMTKARVYIAAGLPLTWVESQRESFRASISSFVSRDTFGTRTHHRAPTPQSRKPCRQKHGFLSLSRVQGGSACRESKGQRPWPSEVLKA